MNRRLHVEGPIVYGGQQQLASGGDAGPAQVFLFVLEDDLVDAFFRGLAGPAIADFDASQRLNLERHVLQDVRHVGAPPQPLEESSTLANAATVLDHRGQPTHQAFVEARDFVRRTVLQLAQVHPSLDDGRVGPDVRATQGQDFTEFHICELSKTGAGGGLV